MQVGAQPWYLQFFWWAANITQVVYPIATIVILGIALMQFKRLVDHLVPKKKTEEVVEDEPKDKAKEEEPEF